MARTLAGRARDDRGVFTLHPRSDVAGPVHGTPGPRVRLGPLPDRRRPHHRRPRARPHIAVHRRPHRPVGLPAPSSPEHRADRGLADVHGVGQRVARAVVDHVGGVRPAHLRDQADDLDRGHHARLLEGSRTGPGNHCLRNRPFGDPGAASRPVPDRRPRVARGLCLAGPALGDADAGPGGAVPARPPQQRREARRGRPGGPGRRRRTGVP